MSLIINTNISSLDAQRNLWSTGQDLQVAMQRLSSGLRVNSAKDDAAGYAIASTMTAQINGLGQAVSNSNNANGMVQTMMGAMNQVQDALQRMNELAVEAADGSQTASTRTSLNQEYQQLMDEITTIAGTTQFNGQTVLNSVTTSSQGANLTSANGIASIISDGNAVLTTGDYTLGVTVTNGEVTNLGANLTSANGIASIAAVSGDTPSLGTSYALGVSLTQSITYGSSLTGVTAIAENNTFFPSGTLAFDVNISASVVTLTVGTASITFAQLTTGSATVTVDNMLVTVGSSLTNISSGSITVGDLTANFTMTSGTSSVTAQATTTSASFSTGSVTFASLSLAVNYNSSLTNITASNGFDVIDSALLSITTASGTNATYTITTTTGFTSGTYDFTTVGVEVGYNASLTSISSANTFVLDAAQTVFQTGANNGNTLSVTGVNVTVGSSGLSISGSDLTSQTNASAAIDTIATALSTLASSQGTLGAISNRLDTQVANLQNVQENTTAARSQIVDADFAAETAQMTKDIVLQQAGISVLAQANSEPQMVLKLLG
ncbi:MAG: flagellin [Nitrospiraceae bacterium]|nr:flagellin [Nitrospiraceae bacterium]